MRPAARILGALAAAALIALLTAGPVGASELDGAAFQGPPAIAIAVILLVVAPVARLVPMRLAPARNGRRPAR